MFGTPRKDAGESEAKSPPPSKANGTETEGFPSPQAMMKEDMLKAMTPQEVGSQTGTYRIATCLGAIRSGPCTRIVHPAAGACAGQSRLPH